MIRSDGHRSRKREWFAKKKLRQLVELDAPHNTINFDGCSSIVRGYAMGGENSGNKDEIDGIEFGLTETAINPAATLAVARSKPAGCQSGGVL